MELYTPVTDNFFEDRSDETFTVVNKRRNYENLRRSIEAHKNRLAMARIKKGKNLPFDDPTKSDNTSYCRQSTADTNEYEGPYRFRRHTRSSLSKINTQMPKNNSMGSSNGMEERYGQEQLYIKRFEDFGSKEQSLARYNMNLPNNYSNKSNYTFENSGSVKMELDSKELENKIVEVLGKLVLRSEFRSGLEELSKQQEPWNRQVPRDGNHDKVVDLLTKCISTTLNSAANDSCDNLSSSRTSKSVNVEINLNVPQSRDTEPLLSVNMDNDFEEAEDVFIENVFSRDSKEVKENILKSTLKKFKSLYSGSKDKGKTKESDGTRVVNNNMGVEKDLKGGQKNWSNTQVKNGEWDEQMLWSRGNQVNRKNGPGEFVFRPFSRSKSQSLNGKQSGNAGNSQSLFRTNSLIQQSKGVPLKNMPFTPVQRGNCGSYQKVMVQSNKQLNGAWNNQVSQNGPGSNQIPEGGTGNSQLSENGVDLNFNPFNLPQNLNRQQNGNQQQNLNRQQTGNNQQSGGNFGVQQNLGNYGYNWNNGPMVKRNNSSARFSRRNPEGLRQGGTFGCFQTDLTERFERRGVNCLETFGKVRQGTRPVLVRTVNLNHRMCQHPGMFQNKLQSENGMRQPPTPVGLPMAKRMNTEPNNFKGFNGNSPGIVMRKQMTGDLNFKRNLPTERVKLLESKRVINTLNKLSDLKTMYHL